MSGSSGQGVRVSLPVLAGGGGASGADRRCATRPAGSTRRFRPGRLRAAVLVGVHVLIAVHVALWVVSGLRDGVRSTLSPAEPSEAMWTLERGAVNAGFVLFALAILSTLIFGRWFCGWACHVVALQDLCAHLLNRAGVRPKPFRARLLAFTPTALAAYMFAWPTLRREVVAPLVVRITGEPEPPVWLGEVIPLRGFHAEFFVEDFWATFPPWYVAIPFLFVCGFACVYVLGSKGFCTYGCPYGGVFGPVDRLAPVRILVNDDCERCGHCTAVCTSNVRVAEEVHAFGMVVDSGCMKCLDCVSACPKEALRVGWGPPAGGLLARDRSTPADRAARRAARRARFDLSWPEEVALAGVFLLMLAGFRGLFGVVPLLMAVGMAGLGAFAAWKCWRMALDADVRGPRVQLKRSGRMTAAGWAFAAATALAGLVALQGLAMNFVHWRGELAYAQVGRLRDEAGQRLVTRAAVLGAGAGAGVSGGAVASDPRAARLAREGLGWFGLARPIWRGGVGLQTSWAAATRMAWLSAVAGDLEGAEAHLRRALALRGPRDDLVLSLGELMHARGASVDAVEAMLRGALADDAALRGVRRELAALLISTQREAEGLALFRDAVLDQPGDVALVRDAATLHVRAGRAAEALALLRTGLASRPASMPLRADLAGVLALLGQLDAARAEAEALSPRLTRAGSGADGAYAAVRLAEVFDALGEPDRAAALRAEAFRLRPRGVEPDAGATGFGAGDPAGPVSGRAGRATAPAAGE